MEPNFNSSMFSLEIERIYFERWLALAPNLAGGGMSSRFWTATLPQLCAQEPAIRSAAVAIGAMALAVLPDMAYKARDALMSEGPHYRNALTYYGRAIRIVRLQRRPDYESGLRAALLSCLLFICFEALHDNREPALYHATHGLQILEQLIRSCSGPDASFDTVLTKSPSPWVLEDEVMQIFQRVDVLACSLRIMQPSRAGAAAPTPKAVSYPFSAVPSSFADLQEAQRWWDVMSRWMIQLPRRLLAEQERQARRADDEPRDGPGASSAELQREHLACLEAWDAAFSRLYSAAAQNRREDEETYLRCVSMRFQYVLQWLSDSSMCFSRCDAMPELTPHFRELNRLASMLLPRQKQVGGFNAAFTLDSGPTLGLFITSTKCCDAAVRDEAIRLLGAYPRRDGFWDSRALNAAAGFSRKMEREKAAAAAADDQDKQFGQSYSIELSSRSCPSKLGSTARASAGEDSALSSLSKDPPVWLSMYNG